MKKFILSTLVFFSIFSVMFLINTKTAESFQLFKKCKKEETQKMQTINQVRASHLLVKTEAEAKQIREDILSGKESFETAAEKYSLCPSGARSGGDLGFFGRGMMVPEFETAAFSLPVGEVSEPVKTQFGWHLIVVTATK